MDYFSLVDLNKEPFSNSPDPDYFFRARRHVECLQKLELALRLKRGLNVVIGDVGTGKTTLCRQLIRNVAEDETIETHLILDPYFSDAAEFLRRVARMLGCGGDMESADTYQLKETIKKILFEKGVDRNKIVVLIIDEGQKIPAFCLEILREFLNYETNTYKLLQIAIFAQHEFDQVLENYENFADRINLYHRLEPMGFRDTRRMIQFRINQSSVAHKKLTLFTLPALWKIYRASKGYPRKIVNLCHRSVLTMIVQNKTRADWFLVRSCVRRAFAMRKKRRWQIAATALLLLLAGGYFIPRIDFNISSMPVAGEPEPHKVPRKAVDSPSEPAEIPLRAAAAVSGPPENKSLTLQTAAPLSTEAVPTAETDAAPPLAAAPTAKTSPADRDAAEPAAVEHPDALGTLKIARRETLGGLILKTYGVFNTAYLKAVVNANPHIPDPDAIAVGQRIVFPMLPMQVAEPATPSWWVEITRESQLDAAYTVLRNYPRMQRPPRLIPHWNPKDGLTFSVVLSEIFYDESSALDRVNQLPPSMRANSRIFSDWGEQTVFCADPYTGRPASG